MPPGQPSRFLVAPVPGKKHRGLVVAPGLTLPCALGRAGITRRKREGDGATPLGRFGMVALFFRPDRLRPPPTFLPVAQIRPDSGWCDDPADRRYNRPVRLPYPASHERLWRDDHLYDLVVILDYNLAPPLPGRGSAIFLHLATPGLAPTAGCVAVTESGMRRLLVRAGRGSTLDIRAAA